LLKHQLFRLCRSPDINSIARLLRLGLVTAKVQDDHL